MSVNVIDVNSQCTVKVYTHHALSVTAA